ncbi:hypothetical protein DWQ67_07210 [Galactobacter caseinivorans]|uniref:DUF2092 domain-containing protein n=1 Tax=Galactobacter caseinivorans TaxID=2676123 RepID=A0A496PK54_9MICC|nr:hypothetical protein DWQ67_07210 [Galactobacter caseinivorans]
MENLKNAKSLTVTGGSGKGNQKMDMSAKGAVSKTGDFEIVMKQTDMNVDFRMMRVDGKAYMKGNEAAYTEMMGDESGTTAKLVGDKYLLLSDEMLRSFGESLNLAGLRDELVKITPKPSTKMSAKVGEYDGSPAHVYADSKVTVYVATDGSNRPLAYQETSGTQSYVISEWDKDYSLATPDPDKVMSMEELQKQAQQ